MPGMKGLGALALLVLASSACVVWPAGSGPEAAPMPLAEALDLRDGGRAALIDVRSPQAYAEGHIPGALNIAVNEIEGRAAEIRKLSRLPILYCG
jgi:phage shock protein E